jgi:hypothetical protein
VVPKAKLAPNLLGEFDALASMAGWINRRRGQSWRDCGRNTGKGGG